MDSDYILRYEIYNFFKTISDSFKPTPLELVLIFISIAVFAGVLIGVYRHQKNKAREASLKYSESVFRQAAGKAKLDAGEQDLLRRISEVSPLEGPKRYVIARRPAAFDEAAGVLIESGEAGPEEVELLREKLETCCFTEKHGIASTKDLPKGLHLYIIEKDSYGRHGEIIFKTPETLTIGLREEDLEFEEGSTITCYFKRGTDTLFFRTAVRSAGPGEITISHPVPVKKVQRRKYYRKEIRKRTVIQRIDGKYRETTTLLDLGGGGASAYNKNDYYNKGDQVILYFSVPDYGEMQISGRVVRTSRKGEVIHIEFAPLKEQMRDKIIAHTLQK